MSSKKIIIEFIAILVVLAIAIGCAVAMSFNDTEYTVTVTDKERIVDDETSHYLVFTEDKNGNVFVFENEDNLLRCKFNSSDIQGELKEGCTYNITVVGYRIPFFSMYQNIIEIECLDGGANKWYTQ